MSHHMPLVPPEHDQAARQLMSLRSTALGLLHQLNGKVPDDDLGQLKVLLNVINRIHLQLEGLFDRDYDHARNPYTGKNYLAF